MSNRDKNTEESTEDLIKQALHNETKRPLNLHRQEPAVVRAIHPLGMRVVVKIRPNSNMTDSGLYLPEGAKESTQESLLGEVLNVASAIDDDTDEETNISGIPEGALVLFGKDAGVKIPWDDSLRIIETQDVLALIDEVDLN